MSVDKCPFCSESIGLNKIRSHCDDLSGQNYDLWPCGKCRAWFWWPLKNPGAEWYERDYRYVGLNKHPIIKPIWNHRKVISFLKPFAGKVLDVGCGTGSFLFWAKKNGWDTYGIDFDTNAIEAGQKFFGLNNLQKSDLANYYQFNTDKKFDLITFFDVFEHIDNHVEFVDMVWNMLPRGGHVAMSMPYRHAARWLASNDVPPRHLTSWDRSALKTFFEQRGFKAVRLWRRTEGVGFIVLKLRFRYGRWFSFNTVNKAIKSESKSHDLLVGEPKESLKVSLIKKAARLKDWIIFGIPACVIYLAMLFTRKRYITLYAIFQKP